MGKDKEIVIKIVNRGYRDDNAVKDLIRYILTDKKSRVIRRCTGGKGVCYLDWKKAAEQFEAVQEYYGKKSKRRIYHMVVSFPEREDDLYSIYLFGQRVIEFFFEGYQCVFAVHEDTENLHTHIGWNAVSYRNGKKWHMSKKETEEMINCIKEMWNDV